MALLDRKASEAQEQIVQRLIPVARQAAHSILDKGTFLPRDLRSSERFQRLVEISDILEAQELSGADVAIARYITVQILLGNDTKTYQLPAEDKYSPLYFREH